jgi:hypothetical protein
MGRSWARVGHTGLLQGSLFKISTEDPEQEMLNARAYAALKRIPFDKWCKNYATCHHCGKKGHICPDCELFKADIAAGKIKLRSGQTRDNRARHHGVREENAGRKPPFCKNFSKDPKVKALVSALQRSLQETGRKMMRTMSNPPRMKRKMTNQPRTNWHSYLWLAL